MVEQVHAKQIERGVAVRRSRLEMLNDGVILKIANSFRDPAKQVQANQYKRHEQIEFIIACEGNDPAKYWLDGTR